MKICIAGSRSLSDYQLVKTTIETWASEQSYKDSEVVIVSGGARGADKLGEQFAREYDFPVELYPADWNTYGKRAGYLRNKEMAEVSDIAFIFWDGNSPGTKHMIDLCHNHNVEVHLVRF